MSSSLALALAARFFILIFFYDPASMFWLGEVKLNKTTETLESCEFLSPSFSDAFMEMTANELRL